MSHDDDFHDSAQKYDNKEIQNQCLGATCSELSDKTIPISLNTENGNNEENCDSFPIPPPSSPTFPTLYNDTYGQRSYSRRFSCLTINHGSTINANRRTRTPSLPTLGDDPLGHLNQDSNFKKLLYDNSRRDSDESAYLSRASEISSRAATGCQLEDVEFSHEYSETSFIMNTQSMFEDMAIDENLERSMIERRNSLSYEAIRAYFLEYNPYMHPYENSIPSLDQLHTERRNNVEQPNPHFRTISHRQVVERQFEELFNIPDFSRSRATSIDLFGGIGLPFVIQEQTEPAEESPEEQHHEEDMS